MIFASIGGAGPLALWIVLWIAGIAIGLWLYSQSPRVPGMNAKAQQARSSILVSSLIPCFGFNIIYVFVFYGRYKFHTRGMGNQASLQGRFNNASFDTPSRPVPAPTVSGPGNNPFTTGQAAAAPAPATGPASDPFTTGRAAGGAPAPAAGPANNPFTTGQPSSGVPAPPSVPPATPQVPSPDNPFLK